MLYVTIDLETTGLNVITDHITMIGVLMAEEVEGTITEHIYIDSSRANDHVIELLNDTSNKILFDLTEFKQNLDNLIEQYGRKNIKFIAHNGKFDGKFLYKKLGIELYFDHDTMILTYLYSTVPELISNRGKWLGLKYAATRLLFVPDWNVGLEVKTNISYESIEYLRKDIQNTWGLYVYFTTHFEQEDLLTYKLIMKALDAFKHIELNGIYLDSKRVLEVSNKYTEEANKILTDLTTDYPGVNFNSPKQLVDLLYYTLKLPVSHRTVKGVPSVNAAALIELRGTHPIVGKILKLRKVTKALTFLKDWSERMINSRIYPTFNLHTAVTGRTSCSSPNIQQVPRDKLLKSCFIARPGYVFVQADYSQMELRIVAHVANVKEMKKVYAEDGDLHYSTAQEITGKEIVTTQERRNAKPVNFGFIYGMSAQSFPEYALGSYGMKFTIDQAIEMRESYFRKYPELKYFYEQTEMEMKNTGMVTTFLGRRYKTGYKILLNDKFRHMYRRKVINDKVQSPASDIALMAIIELEKKFRGTNIYIVGSVHDSILFEIPDTNELNATLTIIKNSMEHPKVLNKTLDYLHNEHITVPIKVDIEVGAWGKGVEWKGEINDSI